jgi:hypothetical protein
MPYRNRIKTLESSLWLLDRQITEMIERPKSDATKLDELQNQKLIYRDEISRLKKLQWQVEREELDYGDDR